MPTRQSKIGDADEDGFTLIEVLVSLAILSVSLATLLGIFAMSLDRASQSENEMAARTLAQSLIAQADAVGDPQMGARGGTVGAFAWQLDLHPYAKTTSPSETALANVTASVSWNGSGGRRSLTLNSLRTVPRSNTP